MENQKLKNQKIEKALLRGIIISIFIIAADAFDWCSSLLNSFGTAGFVTVALLFFCGILLYIKVWNFPGLPVETEFDAVLASAAAAGGILEFYVCFLYMAGDVQFHVYKGVLAMVLLLCAAVGLLFRRRILAGGNQEKEYNTFTLKELYQGEIPHDGSIVYMEEEAVEYDLLNRGELIRTISDVIRTCRPRRKYVLSLSGAWGQGKTTILNNVKRELSQEKDIVIIDSFDPWNYESEEALFSGMTDAVFRCAGVPYEISRIRSWKKRLGELIFDINGYMKGLRLFLKKEQETVQEIKALMNDFLGKYNRKIVFILDNIERMEDKHILFLFKLVADVLDLDHIIYVLSYDAKRVGAVLQKAGMEDRYLKKVIQMEFYVPPVDERRKREIFTICLKNLLELYEAEEKQRGELLDLSDSFMDKITDARDMKRFFNSVISSCYGIPDRWIRKLSAKDYVIMELLKRENPLLYREIQENAYYFVSSDREALFGFELHIIDQKKEFDRKAKEYFDSLFSDGNDLNKKENGKWKNLLAEIFPYVENYLEGLEITNTYYRQYGRNDYKTIIRDARICSGKFFSQYFTLQSNDYMEIKLEIEEMVSLSRQKEEELCREKFTVLCRRYPGSDQREIIEMLELFFHDLDEQEWDTLFPVLYEMSDSLNDSETILGYSARNRAYYLLSVGLNRISDSLFERFLVGIQGQYDSFWILEKIISHMRINPNEEGPFRYEGRGQALQDTLRQMAEKIKKDGINLYSDRYYKEYNIWGWYHIAKYMENMDIEKIAAPMLGRQSIYRFLWDMIQQSAGTAYYGYTLKESNINIFTSVERAASLLETRPPETPDEAFVRKVWDAHFAGKNNAGENDRDRDVAMGYSVEVKL